MTRCARLALPLTLLAIAACTPTEKPAAPAEPQNAPETPAAAPDAPPTANSPLALAAPPDAPAVPETPAPVKAPGGSVTVEVLPQFGKLVPDTRELNVLVRLQGQGEIAARRPPLDLAVVIDRSGSMSGDKMRDVKTAALHLLDALTDQDTVTLISYSSGVERHTTRLPADAAGKDRLRQALLAMQAAGMTALGPAMMQALGDLEAGRRDDLRLAHVLLLSDGLANVGESRPEVLGARAAEAFRRGISVSTLGVGLDYNEDLMTRLADMGGGRYHFIKDSDAIASILGDEMKGLVATVARGMELTLRPAAGVELVKVFGYPVTRDGAVHHTRIGSLGAQQTREIVLRLTLPALAPPKVDLGTLALQFADVIADGAPRRIDLPLSIDITTDPAQAAASENKEVTVRVAEVESADRMDVAARAADQGDFAAATGSLQMAIDDLEAKHRVMPSPKLEKRIAELKTAQSEVSEARSSEAGRKAYTKKFKARAYDLKK